MRVSHNFLSIASDPELKQVGNKNTNLCTFTTVETHQRKVGNEWEVTGKSWYKTQVWGDKAVEASFLEKGNVLDISAYVDDNGEIVFRGLTEDKTYKNADGEEVNYQSLTLFDWDVREFDEK